MEPDFSGYVTKANLKCSDGRTITPEAFKHMNGMQVPLVYQHGHKDIDNVLGHMVLEARPDGVYGYGYLNESPAGKKAKIAVQHKDITKMSIFANGLLEKAKQVLHGTIREVSLVLAGANPGASIDFVRLAHSDGSYEFMDDEAVIHTGLDFILGAGEKDEIVEHADAKASVGDVYKTLNEDQKDLVHVLIDAAVAKATSAEHSDAGDGDEDTDNEGDLKHKEEGTGEVTRNVFEKNGTAGGTAEAGHTLTHDAMTTILADAAKPGNTFKAVMKEYALQHGIENIGELFPEAKLLDNRPEWNARRMEWVTGVLAATSKTPFAKIRTMNADITQDEARAKGYITGEYKKEEWFPVLSRTTGPTTIYKKQKLDRDNIIDITDFDVVAWMKAEMDMMIKEELARCILVGDGRAIDDEDKVLDPAGNTSGDGIRSILNDHELYATTINVNIDDANSNYMEVIEAIIRGRRHYKGSGSPVFYTTEVHLAEMLLLRDGEERRYFRTVDDLAAELRVSAIVTVEVMEDAAYADLIGIIVNLTDYIVGTNKGGELTLFDDFDIDYNQYKYLIETRLSGALKKLKSALIIKKVVSTAVLVAQVPKPTFVASTGVVTIPSKTGVVYKDEENVTISAGAMDALDPGESVVIHAIPASGYYFKDTVADGPWTYKRPAA